MVKSKLCCLSATPDLEIQEGYFALQEQRSQILQQPPARADSILLLLLLLLTWLAVLAPHPSPSHFVVMATLTLNSQVGWCWGRDTETVARTAGVLPSILRLDPEDDKGAVDENAHSELQIAARRHRRFITACYWSTPTGQGTHLQSWITSRCHKRAAESQTEASWEGSKEHSVQNERLK